MGLNGRFLAAWASVLLLCPAIQAQEDGVVVYLVRHGETAPDGTRDPALAPAGQARADLLASMLVDAGISHVHSSDYRRTRQTARSVAERQGLEILPYDPRDLESFADRLRETPGRHLVSGHSNTTPELVRHLGGEPGEPMDESEFDRLYVLSIARDGTTATVLLRYGNRRTDRP